MAKVRAALLGCGGMGAALITAASKLDLCDVVVVADPQVDLARELAEKLGCDFAAESDAVLVRDDLEAVFIAAPNHLHAPLTIQAAGSGKHIFCEKPFALTVEDGKAMIAAAEAAGVKLMVGQVLRYISPYVYIRDLIASGEFGNPFCAQVTRIGGSWSSSGYTQAWRLEGATAGGPLFEVSIHEIDLIRAIMGREVRRVSASLDRFVVDDIDYEDTASVLMEFEGGGSAQLLAGQSAFVGSYDGKFFCTKGTVYFDNKTSLVTWRREGDAEATTISYTDAGANYPEDGVSREVREFIEAVANDTPVTIPGEEGLKNVMVAVAAKLSSSRGQAVELPL